MLFTVQFSTWIIHGVSAVETLVICNMIPIHISDYTYLTQEGQCVSVTDINMRLKYFLCIGRLISQITVNGFIDRRDMT